LQRPITLMIMNGGTVDPFCCKQGVAAFRHTLCTSHPHEERRYGRNPLSTRC
jgi:hypothetical protein